MSKTICIHVLDAGFPVCHFSDSRPADWPEGHRWVSVTDEETNSSATCETCKEGTKTIIGIRLQGKMQFA
ncbi:MAG: hypothetical protein AAB488_02445 [Patescibacteria group bacterium]